ncbi:MAG: carbohydrate kinase family protein [Methanobacteriota archaeon]|nr:MAG: carbohydrate kinase family protein [Euryarchaeota archaeon]
MVVVAVVGHVAWDHLFRVRRLPTPPASEPVLEHVVEPGGAGANTAVVLAGLRVSPRILTVVGPDFCSHGYESRLVSLGVDTSHLIRSVAESAKAYIFTDEHNNQISFFDWGCAKQLVNMDPPEEGIATAKHLHIATGHPNYNMKAARIAKKHGCTVSFGPGQDICHYTKKDLFEILANVDILLTNQHEEKVIKKIVHPEDPLELGPTIQVTTLGEKGSKILTQDKEIHVSAYKTVVVDPTGAGDAYYAGFIAAWLKNQSLEFCGRIATATASYALEARGTQKKTPTWEQAVSRAEKVSVNTKSVETTRGHRCS